MKILVLSANIGDLWYAKHTEPIVTEWCSRNKYDFITETRIPHELEDRHITWCKIIFLLKHIKLQKYEWILWLDADAVPMDMDYDIHDIIAQFPDSELIIGGNICNKNSTIRVELNSGIMLVKISDWTQKFFELIMSNVYYDIYKTQYWHEQSAIERAIDDFKSMNTKSKVKILLNPTLSYNYSNYLGDALPSFNYKDITTPFFHNYGKKKDKLCEISKYIRNL